MHLDHLDEEENGVPSVPETLTCDNSWGSHVMISGLVWCALSTDEIRLWAPHKMARL